MNLIHSSSGFHYAAFFGILLAGLAAAATVGLLILQSLQLRGQRTELAEVQADRLRERGDRLRDQARQVSAWAWNWNQDPSNLMNTIVNLRVANSSAEPVFGVVVFVLEHWGADAIYWGSATRTVLPPGEPNWMPNVSVSLAPLDKGISPPVEIRFTDAAGRHWRRTVAGHLDLLPEGKERPAQEAPGNWG